LIPFEDVEVYFVLFCQSFSNAISDQAKASGKRASTPPIPKTIMKPKPEMRTTKVTDPKDKRTSVSDPKAQKIVSDTKVQKIVSDPKDSDKPVSGPKDSDVKDSDVKDSDVKDSDVKDSDVKDLDLPSHHPDLSDPTGLDDADNDFPSTKPSMWKEWKTLRAERELKKVVLKPIPPPPPRPIEFDDRARPARKDDEVSVI
jgi:hypothetical protein